MTDDKRALRERVAEALGWRELRTRQVYMEDYYDSGFEDVLEGVPPGGRSTWDVQLVPDWPNDATDALTLLDKTGHRWMLSGTPSQGEHADGDRYRCEIDDPDNRTTAYGETPALAAIKAWLVWADTWNKWRGMERARESDGRVGGGGA